jgi:hypothetical protein
MITWAPFDLLCPDVASAERYCFDVERAELGVPLGTHCLREFYCVDPGCDCRCVLLHVLQLEATDQPLGAIVHFGWERAKFYRKWTQGDGPWREMSGAHLDSTAPRGPYAGQFLKVLRHLVQDPGLVKALRRHYALALQRTAWGPTPLLLD